MQEFSSTNKVYIFTLIFITFIWGLTFILIKRSIQQISIDYFLFLRFLLATISLGVVLPFSKKTIEDLQKKRTWVHGIVLGILLYLSYLSQTEGLDLTTPAKAAFITAMSVVLVPLFGFFVFRIIPTRRDSLSAVISFMGLILVTVRFDKLTAINLGDIIILITAISLAFHILGTDYSKNLNSQALVTIQLFIVTLQSGIVLFLRNPLYIPTISSFVWFSLIVTAILATTLAFFVQTKAQANGIKPTVIGIIYSFEPVFALIIDVFRGVLPSFQTLIGMGFIFIAVLLVSIKKRDEK